MNISLKLIPITKFNKVLTEANKIVKLSKVNSTKEAIDYIKNNKNMVFNIINKHYEDYIDKFKAFKIIIIENNKETKSLAFSYSPIISKCIKSHK